MAAAEVTVTSAPDGKQTGATTKAASTWGANGATIGGALGFLITYALVKTGFESDPAQSVAVGAALSFILIWIGGKIAGLQGGKRTPTDQVTELERTVVQQVEGVDPELKAAVVAISQQAGLISSDVADGLVPDGTGEHRAEEGAAIKSWSDGSTSSTAVDESPIVTETTVEVREV